MSELQVSAEQAELLAKRLPVKLTDTLSWLNVSDNRDKKTDKLIGKAGTLSRDVDQWEAFNDLTHELSNNTDRAFLSTNESYAQVDKILIRRTK